MLLFLFDLVFSKSDSTFSARGLLCFLVDRFNLITDKAVGTRSYMTADPPSDSALYYAVCVLSWLKVISESLLCLP